MTKNMEDGRIKLYVIWKALSLRKRFSSLFADGDYVPLAVTGEKAKHLVAFARRSGDSMAIVVAPRLWAQLLGSGEYPPADGALWKDTRVELPFVRERQVFRNVFTSETLSPEQSGQTSSVPASTLLANFPVALLTLDQD
jgi:(1->4)-alpha-D-glucan 1-alpha-D-glucosylmutase